MHSRIALGAVQALQGEEGQMSFLRGPMRKKEVPVVGIDYAYLKENPGDADDDDVQDAEPNTQHELATNSGGNTPQGKPNSVLRGRTSEDR